MPPFEQPGRNDRERGGAGLWIGLFAAFVMVYLLSPAPVAWVVYSTGLKDQEHVMSVFRMFYAPIGWAYENIPVVQAAYQAYGRLFGVPL